jgi:ribosomal protein L17
MRIAIVREVQKSFLDQENINSTLRKIHENKLMMEY